MWARTLGWSGGGGGGGKLSFSNANVVVQIADFVEEAF